MKIVTLSAVLCLAAAVVASDIHRLSIVQPDSLEKRGPLAVSRHENQQKSTKHNEHGVEAHKDGRKNSGSKEDDDDDDDEEDDKEKKGGGGKDASKKGPGGKPAVGQPAVGKPAVGKPAVGNPAIGNDGKPIVDGKKGAGVPNPITNPNIPKDYASPLWLVQPYGASIWEQGRAYVISWGPNPDPLYAKNLKPMSLVDIHLMRGPPEELNEVQIIKAGIDSSFNMFQWTVPATVVPATDYSIRITHAGDLDTYSHYFEIVKAGDPRSSESNVGQPLEMPKMGDVPMPLNKSPDTQPADAKPAGPPNPVPADKPATPANAPPAAAKPAKVSAAMDSKSPNIMAFALTLFGTVYLL